MAARPSEIASIIALAAHHRQLDKGGQPYYDHPSRVASAVWAAGYDDDHVTVAYLHDVVEDTPLTLADLAILGFSREVLDAVYAITQRKREKAPAYYARVCANPIARVVKRFDVADNSSEERMALLAPETQERLRAKYVLARRWLDGAV